MFTDSAALYATKKFGNGGCAIGIDT